MGAGSYEEGDGLARRLKNRGRLRFRGPTRMTPQTSVISCSMPQASVQSCGAARVTARPGRGSRRLGGSSTARSDPRDHASLSAYRNA